MTIDRAAVERLMKLYPTGFGWPYCSEINAVCRSWLEQEQELTLLRGVRDGLISGVCEEQQRTIAELRAKLVLVERFNQTSPEIRSEIVANLVEESVALKETIAELREALRPFANCPAIDDARVTDPYPATAPLYVDDENTEAVGKEICVGDLRRAKAVYERTGAK